MTSNIITQKELKDLFKYTPRTGEFFRIKSSGSRKTGDTVGCVAFHNGVFYIRIGINKRNYLAHRLVWLYIHNEWPVEIDHIDGNGTNNKLENLRSATRQDNAKNLKINKSNTSGYSGVSFCNKDKRWQSRIDNNKKRVWLGQFIEFWDAICARKSAEYKYGYHVNHGRRSI